MRRLTMIAALTAGALTGMGTGTDFGGALAQSAPSLPLVSSPFNEIVHPAAKISGARFLGFLAADPEAPGGVEREDGAFRAWIPADWGGSEICLRVMSADGLYESANLYRTPEGWSGGTARFDYPTRAPEALAGREAEELALSVTRGDCAAAEAEAALAGRLDAAPGEEGALLLLNVFRAEETYVEVEGRADAPEILCKPAQASVRMAYDTACRLPAGVFKDGRAELIVMPVKNGELGREIPLTLRFGPLE